MAIQHQPAKQVTAAIQAETTSKLGNAQDDITLDQGSQAVQWLGQTPELAPFPSSSKERSRENDVPSQGQAA